MIFIRYTSNTLRAMFCIFDCLQRYNGIYYTKSQQSAKTFSYSHHHITTLESMNINSCMKKRRSSADPFLHHIIHDLFKFGEASALPIR